MRKKYQLISLIFIFMMIFSLFTACTIWDGTETPVDDAGNVSLVSTVNDNSVTGSTDEDIITPVTVTEEDIKANIDKFIGIWEDTGDSTRYAVIKKTEIGYSYTDNESTFPAEVKNNILQIKIEVDNAIATGEVDEAAGTLTVKYKDLMSVLKKKQ